MGVSKGKQLKKAAASEQTVADTVQTSGELGEVTSKPAAILDETVADVESVMGKAVTSGQYSEATASRQRLERAKIGFVKTVKWVLVVAISAALVFWAYQLNNVTKPIERIGSDVRYLASEDQRLIKKTDALGEKLDSIIGPIVKIAVDIDHLTKEDERLSKKTEELEKQLEDIEQPMESMRSDIEGLGEEDIKLKADMERLREEVKKSTKDE